MRSSLKKEQELREENILLMHEIQIFWKEHHCLALPFHTKHMKIGGAGVEMMIDDHIPSLRAAVLKKANYTFSTGLGLPCGPLTLLPTAITETILFYILPQGWDTKSLLGKQSHGTDLRFLVFLRERCIHLTKFWSLTSDYGAPHS